MNSSLLALMQRAEQVLARVEAHFPVAPATPDWATARAFRWRRRGGHAYLQALPAFAGLAAHDLQHVAAQKAEILRNTQQFVRGLPANNVLLTGARGTGKSSLIKACLHEFATQGLRMIEVDKADLLDLPDIIELIGSRPEKFIVFCDDLSFEDGEASYKALKVALDGGLTSSVPNLLVYATSNRRHLLPEHFSDNASYRHAEDGELHPGEGVEEKISLSERFGLWLSFYPFAQDAYLDIVAHWLTNLGCSATQISAARSAALQWALQRGSRSGRVAAQFARDYAGRTASGRHQ